VGGGGGGDGDDDDDDNDDDDKVPTDREVTANWPDIIIKNKKEKTCILVDGAIPEGRKYAKGNGKKKLKYKSLCTEIQQMWNLKCMIILVIIGATGIVTKMGNIGNHTREIFNGST